MKSLQAGPAQRPQAPRPGPGAPVVAQGAAPLPRHLQGAGLGVQDPE